MLELPATELHRGVDHHARAVDAASPAEPSDDLRRLLAERELRSRRAEGAVPTRIPASLFKDYVTGFRRTAELIARPMPERPYPQTRIGTDFHAWVEHRYELAGAGTSLDDAFWETDSEAPALTEAELVHDDELRRHQEHFLRSEWADLRPLEVESEVNYLLRPSDGSAPHIMICKLDAVFRRADRGGRIEIVDWKTGRPPGTRRERDDRLLQLAHYRVAYHHARGVPLEDIDVALFYVGHGEVLRPDRVQTEEELAELWTRAAATGTG